MVFLLNAATFAVEPLHDPGRLDQVVAAQQGHTTVQGTLRWLSTRLDDATTPVKEQQLRFYLAFPQRYRVIVTKPADKEFKHSFVSDGTTRWELMQLYDGEAPDIKAVPVGDGDDIEQRLLACFRFDLAALRRDFSLVATAETPERTAITLSPLAAKLKEQLTVLVLTFDAGHRLTAIRSEDPQGNRHDFLVQEAVYDQPLDDGLFRVGP